MIRKVLLAATLLVATGIAHAGVVLSEGFDDISTLAGSGWAQKNESTPGGTVDWFQGNDGVFPAQSGLADSYIGASFSNTGFGGDISNWLITPTITLSDRMFLTFSTRSEGFVPDRLEVRLSTNGSSIDVGTTETSVGDFTTLLATINPALDDSYPSADWATYTINLGGFADGSLARLAFRYYVTDTFTNGDYIGIDSVSVNVPEPSTFALFGLALALCVWTTRRRLVRCK